MGKLIIFVTFMASLLTIGCTSKIDKEVTLVKGVTTMQEVEEMLGAPEKISHEDKRVLFYYSDSHLYRDITTGLLIGWQFLDNHVLTLCDARMKNCRVFKGKEDESAKSLSIYFKNGVVSNAEIR
jgi:hypothetical protein